MKGRTEEAIKKSIQKMKRIAEIYADEELELINSYIEAGPPENINQPVWYLGKSLEKLAEADVFIGIDDVWNWHGCEIEQRTANMYGIKAYSVPSQDLIPDYEELVRSIYPVCGTVHSSTSL